MGHLQDAGNTTTLARYLDLLETAGLVAGLPKFAKAPPPPRISAQAQCAEHRTHDGFVRLHVC